MLPVIKHKFVTFPSTWLAFILWIVTAFLSQPTITSLLVHVAFLGPGLLLLTWLAHWEGKNTKDQ